MTALLGTAVLLWQLASGSGIFLEGRTADALRLGPVADADGRPVPGDGVREATRADDAGIDGDSARLGSVDGPSRGWTGETASEGLTGGISTTGVIELPDTATSVTGTASWYCGAGSRCTRGYPGGLYAAAGPALRVGDWRGRRVTVCSAGRCVNVKLIDFCACPSRVIDLYRDAFARLASPSRGVIRVTVSSGGGPSSTLPPTSTEVIP